MLRPRNGKDVFFLDSSKPEGQFGRNFGRKNIRTWNSPECMPNPLIGRGYSSIVCKNVWKGHIWIIFMPLNCSIFDIVCEITGNGTLKTLKISLQTSNMFLAFSGENHFCILNSQISNDIIFQYVDIHRNIECRYI